KRQYGECRSRSLYGRDRSWRDAARLPEQVSRSDRELPPERPNVSRALRSEPALGDRRDADQRDPPDRLKEQMDNAGFDRTRIQRSRGLGCGEGSREMS